MNSYLTSRRVQVHYTSVTIVGIYTLRCWAGSGLGAQPPAIESAGHHLYAERNLPCVTIKSVWFWVLLTCCGMDFTVNWRGTMELNRFCCIYG
ncbi:MAG: hypothetical protein ABR887_05570 [Methanoregulaceae archaeon]